ncbi:ABC transporter substrate-binding protein [Achromobacter marplatensis]|uniref:ABC transporter substrate-binding protein n=1 Tax=Achromobacter marplatensis TaxID=470868 RepID=UPI0028E31DED|nr:ABC transporter substrate-binding protein [Achromobacter marplatensis]
MLPACQSIAMVCMRSAPRPAPHIFFAQHFGERKQVTLILLPAANIEQALRQGQIDLALLSAGFQVQAEQQGAIRKLFDDHQLYGDVNLASIVFSADYVGKNPETVKHFAGAVAKAVEWLRAPSREEAVAVYKQYLETHGQGTAVNGLQYWQGQSVATPGGALLNEDFARWVAWQQEPAPNPWT